MANQHLGASTGDWDFDVFPFGPRMGLTEIFCGCVPFCRSLTLSCALGHLMHAAGVQLSSKSFMVAELRCPLEFLKSSSDTVARGGTQTPLSEDTSVGLLCDLFGLLFRGSGLSYCLSIDFQGSFGET